MTLSDTVEGFSGVCCYLDATSRPGQILRCDAAVTTQSPVRACLSRTLTKPAIFDPEAHGRRLDYRIQLKPSEIHGVLTCGAP
jgi:hypothetical protein